MKCSTHAEADASAVCMNCGRGLCSLCAMTSQSGRMVCSATCEVRLKQVEDVFSLSRTRAIKGGRSNPYFLLGIAILFGGFGLLHVQDPPLFELGLFLIATAGVFVVLAVAQLRVILKSEKEIVEVPDSN